MFTEPDESYHGIVYTEQFGKAAYIVKARVHLMRDLGAQAGSSECFPSESGAGNSGSAYGAALQKRPGRGRVSGRP